MNCTVKIIAGPDAGQEFQCGGADTVIGRSPRSTIRISSSAVSYEHAVISRNGSEYFLENLSANGTFLNNDRLAAKTRLRLKDQIRLDHDTVLRVENLPAAATAGSSRRLLLIAFVALLAVLLAVVIWDPFSESSPLHWPHAYTILQEFVQVQAVQNVLPPETPALFREAWRLESAGDRAGAAPQWIHLHVLLAGNNDKAGLSSPTPQGRAALAKLLQGDQPGEVSNPDDLRAALMQFIIQMERRK